MHVAHPPTVMVVENFEDTRELLRFWLETEGCRVVEAANGQEAVELTRGQCPDLVLMSLRMPVLDGFDTTRRMREHRQESDFPIVCMSTYPTKQVKDSALAAGCSSFIAQPVDFDSLRDLFSRLLPGSVSHQSPVMN
jgi:CheY-like chemotaxis protein